MVISCLLCLENQANPGPTFLEIFGEDGTRLDISSIINKHFWLKINRNSEDVQVCLICWEVVRDFHMLYQRVEQAHKHFEVKTIVLDDPLTRNVMFKLEDDQDPIKEDNVFGDSIFEPEVKVEVNDLDLLPQIEILESVKKIRSTELPSSSNAQLVCEVTAMPIIKSEQNADFANASKSFENNIDEYSDNKYTSSDSEIELDWPEVSHRNEKVAVIRKKQRIVLKKYKKREKLMVEPKRLSHEEIVARQSHQDEYDSIITKFFKKIPCPKCELLLHTFGEMRAHLRLDHNDNHGFIGCCGGRFATRKSLAEHIMVHYNPEHFKCKTCDKICRDSTQLESHEQTHLPNPPPSKYKKMFECEKCSKTFSSKAPFERHRVAKHLPPDEFKFECAECKKK